MTTNNEAAKVGCRMAPSAGCRLVLFYNEFTGCGIRKTWKLGASYLIRSVSGN